MSLMMRKKLRKRQEDELNCATGCDHAFGTRHETGESVRKRERTMPNDVYPLRQREKTTVKGRGGCRGENEVSGV